MKKKYYICAVLGMTLIAGGVVVFLISTHHQTTDSQATSSVDDVTDKPMEDNTEPTPNETTDSTMFSLEQSLRNEKYFIERRLERYLNYAGRHPEFSAAQIVKNINCDFDKTRYQDVVDADLSYGELSLVSKYYYLGQYEPADLIDLGSYSSGSATKMQKTAGEAFIRMADAAARDGLTLKNISGYRSYNRQNQLYNNYAARDGYAEADTYSSRPGYSEHQTGLATDINSVSQTFENTAEFAWLQKHAAEYGFIMRYPNGLEDITGFMYEPWHYRYVGVDAAQQIVAEGLTFEEYYAYYIEK